MTNQHPITPPPKLVQEWFKLPLSQEEVLVIAAQWGADQELKACCALMDDWGLDASDLRAARRPKPPSLKEMQVLRRIKQAISSGDTGLAITLLEDLNDTV